MDARATIGDMLQYLVTRLREHYALQRAAAYLATLSEAQHAAIASMGQATLDKPRPPLPLDARTWLQPGGPELLHRLALERLDSVPRQQVLDHVTWQPVPDDYPGGPEQFERDRNLVIDWAIDDWRLARAADRRTD